MARAGEPEYHATEDVGRQGLVSLAFLEGLAPVERGQLEDPVLGPPWQQAEQVADVAEGLDPVQAAASQQRHEGGVHSGTVVAADERPVLSAHPFPSAVVAVGRVWGWGGGGGAGGAGGGGGGGALCLFLAYPMAWAMGDSSRT